MSDRLKKRLRRMRESTAVPVDTLAITGVIVLMAGLVVTAWPDGDAVGAGGVAAGTAEPFVPEARPPVKRLALPSPAASAAGPPGSTAGSVPARVDRPAVPRPVAPKLPPVAAEAFEVGIESVDPAQRVPKPDAVRGVYVNAWSAASSRRRAALLELADTTELNAFVIDVKDATGHVSYPSSIPFARRIGADDEVRIRDVRRMLETLREEGVYPIARIVVFKDPLLATHRPDWAIQREDGAIWRDHHEEIWVDPYNRQVWQYNIALAREAIALGFAEVQWDYVRFPDVPSRYMRTAVYPARQDGRSRAQNIRTFLNQSRERFSELGVPVTADVFGLTVSALDDMGIGQYWPRIVDAVDVLLPMTYPSHFGRGSYGIAEPNAVPYAVIRTAMAHARRRTDGVDGAAAIRPWLQDFSLGEPAYGPPHVRAQIEAVYDSGLDEWVLWNPSSRYTAAALAPEGGPAPSYPLPGRDRMAVTPDSLSESEPSLDGLLGEPVDTAGTGGGG